jgi:rhodanese-related sulfurtransferase
MLGLCAALFATTAMAQTPAPAPAQPQPQAPKMDSDDVFALVEKGQVFFLDVREPDELEKLGTLEGYVNIPLGQIEKRLAEIPRDKAIVTA